MYLDSGWTLLVVGLGLALSLLAPAGCADDGGSDSSSGDGDGDGDGTSTGGDGDGDGTSTGGDGDTTTDPTPDMGMSGACDPFEQDCPNGEKCVPFQDEGGDWIGYQCVEIMGEQAPGEPCTYGGFVEATDDCDGTGACWGISGAEGELVGTCLAFCNGSADTPVCFDGSHCLVGSAEIYLCVDGCNPLLQDCAEDEGCYWSGQFSCASTTSNIPVGEPCGFTNDCEPGLTCAASQVVPGCAGDDCCVAFCDVGLGDEQCAALAGASCYAFLPPNQAPLGYEHLGVCIAP